MFIKCEFRHRFSLKMIVLCEFLFGSFVMKVNDQSPGPSSDLHSSLPACVLSNRVVAWEVKFTRRQGPSSSGRNSLRHAFFGFSYWFVRRDVKRWLLVSSFYRLYSLSRLALTGFKRSCVPKVNMKYMGLLNTINTLKGFLGNGARL